MPEVAVVRAVAEQLECLLRSSGEVAGIGIDHEPWRESADLRTARFFLRPAEQAHVLDARGLLRLWTVKEALFKATPANANTVLVDYEITDPSSRSGSATGPRGEELRYLSAETEGGVMAVALCLTRSNPLTPASATALPRSDASATRASEDTGSPSSEDTHVPV